MVIFDNIISLLQKTGGVNKLFEEIWAELDRVSFPYYLLYEVDKSPDGIRLMERYRDCRVPSRFSSKNYIFHSTYYRLEAPHKYQGRVVTTVHDFTYERFIGGIRGLVHTTQKLRAINRSDIVICVSDSTKMDLLDFLPSFPENKIRVIHNGVSDTFQPSLYTLDGYHNHVLFVGRRGRYKNFQLLVEALAQLKDLKLVCVGGGEFSLYERVILHKYLRGRYEHLGYVSDAELNLVYNSVLCLVYPSLYEGFGIPVLEAMRAGCPVVALRTSSIPEVAGEAAILISDPDVDELCAAIRMTSEQFKRTELRNLGFSQSSRFSWRNTARSTIEVYEELI